MNLDNQTAYWDKVANQKTFTHPIDKDLVEKYLNPESTILDFGCGYGRIVRELTDLGFQHVTGFDTSKELIQRGKREDNLPIFHIDTPLDLPVKNETIDCVVVFAVLTCIPSNQAQTEIIGLLHSKLKKGGLIYISDYYLQNDTSEVKRYTYLNEDKENYGVFELAEGATFRHHTREWIAHLMKDFTLLEEKTIEVTTMNGHKASAFQWIGRK